MPRPKKYDWSDKRDICYRLYVEEKLPIRAVVQYFSETLGVPKEELPPTTTFNRQFKEWEFPPRRRHPTADEEAQIVERTRELWQQNQSNDAIVETLKAEGWDFLPENTLSNIRRRHGLILRGGSQYDYGSGKGGWKRGGNESATATTPGQADGNVTQYELPAASNPEPASQQPGPELPSSAFASTPGTIQNQPIEATARSSKRLLDLQQESNELFQSRKRRRRTRPRGQLPPDAPGLPPRYRSETSLDECKVFLQLSNDQYQTMREQFMDICTEMNIVKKTQCEPGVWEASKNRLIRDNPFLGAVMNAPHPEADKIANALEVICLDVTKRLRVLNNKVTIQDANNGLHLNPAESKHIRRLFCDILAADGFTTRYDCSDAHWEELYQLWLPRSELLLALQARGIDEHTRKLLGVLMRDSMKRYHDERVRKDPNSKQYVDKDYNIGPGPARAGRKNDTPRPTPKARPAAASASKSSMSSFQPQHSTPLPTALPLSPLRPQSSSQQPQPSLDLDPALFAPPPPIPPLLQIPAFFRLLPSSHLIGHHPKNWLARIETLCMHALRQAATSKTGAAKASKIYGIVKGVQAQGNGGSAEAEREDNYLIESDGELEAYLEAAKENSEGKVIFAVELSGGYA